MNKFKDEIEKEDGVNNLRDALGSFGLLIAGVILVLKLAFIIF